MIVILNVSPSVGELGVKSTTCATGTTAITHVTVVDAEISKDVLSIKSILVAEVSIHEVVKTVVVTVSLHTASEP